MRRLGSAARGGPSDKVPLCFGGGTVIFAAVAFAQREADYLHGLVSAPPDG